MGIPLERISKENISDKLKTQDESPWDESSLKDATDHFAPIWVTPAVFSVHMGVSNLRSDELEVWIATTGPASDTAIMEEALKRKTELGIRSGGGQKIRLLGIPLGSIFKGHKITTPDKVLDFIRKENNWPTDHLAQTHPTLEKLQP